MRYLAFEADDPSAQLACDEALLRWAEDHNDGEWLRLYELTSPTVVLGIAGRYRAEANFVKCRSDGVLIRRRHSGGGAVLLGKGCLVYSLVLDTRGRPEVSSVRRSYEWILATLAKGFRSLGCALEQAGISDMAWLGRKVGGSAQRRGKRFLLHHGTLLYDFDISRLGDYLPSPSDAPAYRGGRGHAEFLANLPLPRTRIIQVVRETFASGGTETLTHMPCELERRVEELARRKYDDQAWNLRR